MQEQHLPESGAAFEAWLARLMASDEKAWGAFIRHLNARLKPWMYKQVGAIMASSVISRNDIVEEAYSETLHYLYREVTQGTFATLPDLRGWAFAVARYKLKEAWRTYESQQRLYFPSDGEVAPDQGAALWQEAQHIQALSQRVHEGLAQLDEVDRQILQDYAEGLSFDQIADRVDLPAATCRKRKQRALTRLRAILTLLFVTISLSLLYSTLA